MRRYVFRRPFDYTMLRAQMSILLQVSAVVPAGGAAIMNQLQGSNLGADLYGGSLIA